MASAKTRKSCTPDGGACNPVQVKKEKKRLGRKTSKRRYAGKVWQRRHRSRRSHRRLGRELRPTPVRILVIIIVILPTNNNNNTNNNSRFDKIECSSCPFCIFFILFRSKSSTFPPKKGKNIKKNLEIIDRFFFAPHHLPTRIHTHRRRRRKERNPNCSSSSSCSRRRRRWRWRLSLRGAKMFCREEGDRRLKK